MKPLTPGADIDELRRLIGESEQRRQAAEIKLADRERRLGTARQTIAAQDRRIGWLMAEAARLRDAAGSTMPDDYARDARRFFNVYSIGGAHCVRLRHETRDHRARCIGWCRVCRIARAGNPCGCSTRMTMSGRVVSGQLTSRVPAQWVR